MIRLKVVCASEGGCNAKRYLSDAQLETLCFSIIHQAVEEELWSQDFVTDGQTCRQGVFIV